MTQPPDAVSGGRPVDGGRSIDWGRTSADYASHRPGPPPSFYAKLRALDVGLPGQRILDLGTGTGVLAREFAATGARATGVDLSAEQVEVARTLAREQGLDAVFRAAPAEALPFEDKSFDVVTANQCWGYFDLARTVLEVRRVLVTGGSLVVSHFSFLPSASPIVRASEDLVLEYNPDWGGARWDGRVTVRPRWSRADLLVRGFFVYDEPIPFTRESWRGRMRALRGIGASLPDDDVSRFDREHDELLRQIAPERFTIVHRIDAHVFGFREDEAAAPL